MKFSASLLHTFHLTPFNHTWWVVFGNCFPSTFFLTVGGNAGAWNVLVCNEGLNLVNYLVQGVGNDMYWPPNVARDYDRNALINASLAPCDYTAEGLYGVR